MSERMNSDNRFGERYRLHEQLWCDGPHGGRLATDCVLRRKVVINFPYRPNQDLRFLQRVDFRARFRHANLIPVYELGRTTDGRPFFTEPYIEATDLGTLLQDTDKPPVTLPRLVAYLLDACKALAFLHQNGFVHLQMQPHNILVAADSHEVFLVRGNPSLPSAELDGDTRLGLLEYMAPEQGTDKLGSPDTLADVYGVGGVLFAILHDASPNNQRGAPPQEALAALVDGQGPPSPEPFTSRAWRYHQLARRLKPVCLRALNHDRRARQPSVAALIEEIEDAMSR